MLYRVWASCVTGCWLGVQGIDKFHQAGLVHGDLKNDNFRCNLNPSYTSVHTVVIDAGSARKAGIGEHCCNPCPHPRPETM